MGFEPTNLRIAGASLTIRINAIVVMGYTASTNPTRKPLETQYSVSPLGSSVVKRQAWVTTFSPGDGKSGQAGNRTPISAVQKPRVPVITTRPDQS